jgi:long-chain acyl-CoA synthetase
MEAAQDMALTALRVEAPGTAEAAPRASATVHHVDGCTTIPALFWKKVGERGDAVAMREKDFGVWRSITWRQFGERARRVGIALRRMGFARGEVVSIMSENVPEWLYTDMGVMGIGGIVNGVYTTDSARQVEYLVRDSRTKFFFAENEEQLDKILEVREACPTLERIFVFDMEGLDDFSDPQVMSFDALLAAGEGDEALWASEVAAAQPEDIALLIYTSGTTGPPKGAMMAHRNLIFQIARSETLCSLGPGDQLLSFLPLCHIAERKITVLYAIRTGATINFAERPETVPENIREVAPTFFFAVPRIWEKFYSEISIRMAEAIWIGRLAYRLALAVGYRVADLKLAGKPVPAHLALAFRIVDRAVLRNIKLWLGIDRARILGTGAAPVSPELIRWYLALGLEMREVYGQTECCGLATVMPERKKLGYVGTRMPDTEVRISEQGEILIRGPHVFPGYLNNPEKTAETIDAEGWLHTGDVGEIDDEGYVRITDRLKDIIITAGGKNITPSELENQLKFSPYISDAVVIGDKRKYLTCLVMIDHENVAKFAQDRSVPFTNYASLCAAREVQELIRGEIEKVNRTVARVETIKDFRLIDVLLTAEDEELTPTMKLKRKQVNQKYQALINQMYPG